MKVLIISAFPPDPAPEANHTLHLSEHLAKSGLNVHILSKKGSITANSENIVVHPIMDNWSWSELPRLTKCLKRYRPDVVLLIYIGWIYNHKPMITFLPTICQKVLPGVPCVTQFENVDVWLPYRSFKERMLNNVIKLWIGKKNIHSILGTLLRDSSRIIALSSPHRASLVKQNPEVEEKSVIIPPSPLIRLCPDQPATIRQCIRNKIGAEEDDFVLIYWGYIYPGKGLETLLEAFQIAFRHNPKLRLIIVGGKLDFPTEPISCSDYFKMVQKLPNRLGITERVTWTGHFNWDSDTGSMYLHAGDICVLPFDYGVTLNNSSLAAACTHGLPVISTELLEGRDEALENGRNIYLCRPRDPEMLAEAIQLLSSDTNLRQRLSEGSLCLARNWYNWDTTTKRLEGLLNSIVSNEKVPGRGQSLSSVITTEIESCKSEKSANIHFDKSDEKPLEAQLDNRHLFPLEWSENYLMKDINVPLVSIVVAVYNVEKYLSQCLDSLVHQTLKNIDIIVVNDASTDSSLKIINDYKARYPNIRVVNCKHNVGLASVRNIGMRNARGEYIGFADGDDWVDIRMCEVMYRHASEDNSDVLIADATVFYDDSKTFGKFFDQHIRQILNPQLRRVPFDLSCDSRILLLEPVAWTKLYKRSFLENHKLVFEDGMNSYEDMCFHFAVLLKATRISLIDDALPFYRQNRPGQISGRTSRKVFEVFDVFDRIHENLVASDVSEDIWTVLIKIQLKQFDWLLKDRVQPQHKREFLSLASKQLQKIPKSAIKHFMRKSEPYELARLLCIKRNKLHAFEKLTKQRWPLSPLLYIIFHNRRHHNVLKKEWQYRFGMLIHWRLTPLFVSFANKILDLAGFKNHWQTVHDKLNHLTSLKILTPPNDQPLIEIFKIREQTLIFSDPSYISGLGDAVWRMENDHYLSQMASFREGDTVVDIGAHVGVFSIYLAKKYPFIKVYAIEPDPLKYDCLNRNIELNGVKNVAAIREAVSGDGQNKRLFTSPWDAGWATIKVSMAASQRVLRTVEVESVTLEQLFQKYEIRHCRLLKITALGATCESLQSFKRSGCVDLLCGEIDLEDCSRVKLEMASWRIARQHFWRTIERQTNGTVYSWIHQMPITIERLPFKTSSITSST